MLKKSIVFLILVFTANGVLASTAQEGRRRTLLIEKFKKIYLQLAPTAPSKVPVTLRLADLLAEQARQLSMDEMQAGCFTCNAGENERKEALKYYREVLPKVDADKRGRILSQMGHIYELLGNSDEAISLYRDILKKESRPSLLADANLSLGEAYFKRRDYEVARKHYQMAIDNPKLTRKGLAHYRLAWCHFNLGQVQQAISGLVHILNEPSLLSRGSSTVVSVDRQFQQEVSRDLATFYGRANVGLSQARQLYQQSPDETRLSNVSFLAMELERLGHQENAIEIWRFVMDRQSDPKERLEGMIRLAQLEKDVGRVEKSLSAYAHALDLWAQLGTCTENSCREWKSRLRKYVIDWHRTEKEKPSEALLSTYQHFLTVFPEDIDMVLWAAEVAQQRKAWKQSLDLYLQALKVVPKAREASEKSQNIPSDEQILLSVVGVAEASTDQELMNQAYDLYLDRSEERSKWVDVKYQKAYRLYQAESYEAASVAFKEVAELETAQALKVRLQAADLALDTLVLLKKEDLIKDWAQDFSSRFPQKAAEYRQLARKSILNRTATLARSNSSTQDQKAWEVLSQMAIEEASVKERILYYKNRLILAERLKKYAEARRAANELLNFSELSEEDRQLALSRKAWLAELQMDFRAALKASEGLKLAKMKPDEKVLKLAVLADLAGDESNKYYREFLKTSGDSKKKAVIAAKLVRESAKPQKELNRYKKILRANPSLLGELQLEIYAKTRRLKDIKWVLKDKQLAQTDAGLGLWRQDFMSRYVEQRKVLVDHKVDSSTQGKMSRSLQKRIQLLERAEGLLKEAVGRQDWTAQVLMVALLAQESNRFYQELLSLPMPDGLTPSQQQEYLSLLSQQAGPYQVKSQDLTQKFNEFWTTPAVIQTMQQELASLRGDPRGLYIAELELIQSVAPDIHAPAIQSMIAASQPQKRKVAPNLVALEQVRSKVRSQPFNMNYLKELISVEREMGRPEMVSYLEARLKRIQEEQFQTEEVTNGME